MAGGGVSNEEEEEEERRVVVAVDESDESLYALQWWLCNILTEAGATLVLVYARPSPPVYSTVDGAKEDGRDHHLFGSEEDFVPNLQVPDTGSFLSRDVTATVERYSRDLADSVIRKARSICSKYGRVKVDAKVSAGDARDVICQTVEKVGAELLVMGSHGYGFINRALLGSVSDYCARNAKCPVLIVKRKEG